MVSFAQLNLVEDQIPSLLMHTNAMDVIFCRNVLMYFQPATIQRVIEKLHRALAPGGWLVLGASETSHATRPQFEPVNLGEAILHHKATGKVVPEVNWNPSLPGPDQKLEPIPPDAPLVPSGESEVLKKATALYARGDYAPAAELLLEDPRLAHSPSPAAFSLLTRALANLGQLAGAAEWGRRWVAADKLDPRAHYVQAVILQEMGEPLEAVNSLQRALYLDPDFVLAHFALGNLLRERGEDRGAQRHFSTALRLLKSLPPAESLPESDGMTGARLQEIIGSIFETEAAS
ncbi:MAG: CheR family methyltransferase [Chthoniobacteraceae bacterium]